MARKTTTTTATESGIEDDVTYSVALRQAVQTPAMTYRPGEDHRMTGATLKSLAAIAGLAPAELAAYLVAVA